MITKVTQENARAYEKLFNDANAALEITSADAGYIDTLNQYYRQLAQLAQTLRQAGKEDEMKKFLRLPLDEPTFDIDANTRVITVPAEFKKNGISVKDDEIAEVLYFTIDRYHDTMDFASPDINIAIQWDSAPAADKSVVNGISAALFRDTVVIDGAEKVIFGWAISNKITRNAGTIKFAVRFYKIGVEDNIVYNFNTLVASATVQAGITYDVTGTVFDDTERIINRLTAPGPVNNDDTSVNAPVFVPGFAAVPPADGHNRQEIIEDEATVGYTADLDANGELVLQGLATNGGEGTLLYTWLKAEGSDDTTVQGQLFFPAADEEFSDVYNYYTKTEVDGHDVYTIYAGTPLEGDTPASLGLYIKGTEYTVRAVGTYKLKVQNYLAALGSYKEITSLPVIVPGPDGVYEAAFTDTTEAGPHIANVAQKKFLANGVTTVGIELSDCTPGDKAKFVWKNVTDDEDKGTQNIAINDQGKAISTIEIPEVTENRNAYHKTFSVAVEISRNGATAGSQTFLVELAAAAYTPNAVQVSASNNARVDETHSAVLSAVVDLAGAYSEGLAYQWVKVLNDYDALDNRIWNTENDIEIEGANGTVAAGASIPTYTTNEIGQYYCKVSNIVFGVASDPYIPDTFDIENHKVVQLNQR